MKRADSSQSEIIEALTEAGASVIPLGDGFPLRPAILAGFRRHCYLIQIRPRDRKRARRLARHEQKFLDQWNGHAGIATCLHDALRLVGAI